MVSTDEGLDRADRISVLTAHFHVYLRPTSGKKMLKKKQKTKKKEATDVARLDLTTRRQFPIHRIATRFLLGSELQHTFLAACSPHTTRSPLHLLDPPPRSTGVCIRAARFACFLLTFGRALPTTHVDSALLPFYFCAHVFFDGIYVLRGRQRCSGAPAR